MRAFTLGVIVVLGLAAAWFLWRLSRSNDHRVFKAAMQAASQGPLAPSPTRPKWVAHAWYASLGAAILGVLVLYIFFVREIMK